MQLSPARKRFCEAALEYRGFGEHDGSHRMIIDIYNSIRPLPRGYKMSHEDPWCAAFVSAMGVEAGLGEIILPECSCEAMIELYRKKGLWHEQDEYVPRPGDLLMYDWDDSGSGDNRGAADHVGIVINVSGNVISCLEGNVGDAVSSRSLLVNSRYIRGCCTPDFESVDTGGDEEAAAGGGSSSSKGEGAEPAPGESSTGSVTLSLPQLQRNSTGETVRAAQLLLIGRGSRCGPYGADGIFGDATHGAVWGFQKGHRLETDGIIGTRTWAALLGL